MLIAFDLKKLPHLGEFRAQPSRNFLGLQPSGQHVSKIRPEGPDLPTRLVMLLDGSVMLLAGRAVL